MLVIKHLLHRAGPEHDRCTPLFGYLHLTSLPLKFSAMAKELCSLRCSAEGLVLGRRKLKQSSLRAQIALQGLTLRDLVCML